jgi:hypothetical protein
MLSLAVTLGPAGHEVGQQKWQLAGPKHGENQRPFD